MPPRSPTLAFDPTPALEQNHFSSFNGIYRHGSRHGSRPGSMDSYNDYSSREMQFEDPITNSSIHGRHSISTSHVPLLPAVSSASHIPKQSFRITNPTPGVDITAYFEQCRNVNEQLRKAHEQDRRAWDIERSALKTRIADVEFKLNKASGGSRRLSNESSHATVRPFKPDFQMHGMSGRNGTRHQSIPIPSNPLDHLKLENGKHVWEPESPCPATRVFSHDDDVQHLPSISEDGPALSPQTSHENKPIPIQQIDGTLDGITVKSEGVKSSFSKIMSPIIIASPMSPPRSPSPKQSLEPPRLCLDTSSLLDPMNAKLTKNAGHTPLAFDGILSSNATTVGDPTPLAQERDEKPIAPASTARPPLRPSENSNSYFSTDNMHVKSPHGIPDEEQDETEPEPEPQYEPEDDKSLTGPLMLDAGGKSAAAQDFLGKLDDKLEEVVRKSLSSSPDHSPASTDRTERSDQTDDDNFPQLRMKKSTNFGSAYGYKAPRFAF